MFDTFIVEPIFNLLVFIYALLPGHNFGLSIIIFTVLIRLLMWPLVKKQLHHTKAMREMQPEIKKIKEASKGNKQEESRMLMELYKERGISPFGSIGVLAVQLVILIGLFQGLRRVANDTSAIIDFAYGWVANLPWMEELAANIDKFDSTLFGLVDLQQAALMDGVWYIPALIIVLLSAVAQFYQSKQLLPKDKDQRGLRQIMREAGEGKQADQSEVSAAVAGSTRYFLPFMIVLFTVSLPSALALYWLTGGLVAYIQQSRVLAQDEEEMEGLAEDDKGQPIEGEVIEKPKAKQKPKSRKNSKKKAKKAATKRRKKK